MAIRQINTPIWKLECWGCICDHCGSSVKKLGKDPGEASENARKEGFTTLTIHVARPLKWLCPICKDPKNGKSNGYSVMLS